MKLSRLGGWFFFAIFMVVFFFSRQIVNFYVDWQWFKSVGYFSVFFKIFTTKVTLAAVIGIIFFLIVYINVLIVRKLKPKGVTVIGGDFEIPNIDRIKRYIDRFIILGVFVFSFFVSTGFLLLWDEYLRYVNWTPFGIVDPLFGKDIGFYVFKLPFIEAIYSIVIFVLFVAILVTLAYYFLFGSVHVSMRGLKFKREAEVHLSVLGAVLFIVFAFGTRLAQYNLLFDSGGLIFGAGFTDVHATLPILYITLVASLIVSLIFIVNIFVTGFKGPVFAIAAYFAFSILARGIYPGVVQWLYVSPNEIEAERPYIERNIEFTRRAYKLDNVEQSKFDVSGKLTTSDLNRNQATIKNIRLWDHRPLLSTYSQIQEIRTYYHFVDVDIDRYRLGKDYRQVMLAPRELSYARLPSKVWINEHLIYTHGYGLAMSPVNRVNPEGQPELWVKDLPPMSIPGLEITHPEIYYGEIANNYCFVNTKQKEFDYPMGDENVYTEYEGTGGFPVGGLLNRAMLAYKFGSMKILLSGDITSKSRIMMVRRIVERTGKIAPFLKFDPDPYMVIAEGKLYWIADAYTLSDRYPYSDPFSDTYYDPYGTYGNYFRNSAKVVVDAYNGDVQMFISDPEDPMIKTYAKMFEGVFKPMSEMSVSLRSHVRYPEALFEIQADKFETYHMTDPTVFYNKEDLWGVARETYEGDIRRVEPYYVIMKLPEEKKEEFILMIPFTPTRKDNMSAWMAARCDEPHYGELRVFTFGKKKLIYGPLQIEARIDQEPDISRQLSLWSQRGSDVIRGNMMVIPIEDSILYVEPLYLKAERGQIPELKRVIVSFGNRIVMRETLDSALRGIFGGRTVIEDTGVSVEKVEGGSIDSLIKQANDAFEKSQTYQRQGNWGAYGEQIGRLEEILKKLREMSR